MGLKGLWGGIKVYISIYKIRQLGEKMRIIFSALIKEEKEGGYSVLCQALQVKVRR